MHTIWKITRIVLVPLPHLPQTRTTLEQAIDLRLALRTALRPLGDWGRTLAVLREAESLAVTLDDPRRLGRVSIFLSIHFRFMGAHDHAVAAGQRALTLATASGDGAMQALANQYLGNVYYSQGDYRRAIDCYRQTVAYLALYQHSCHAVQSISNLLLEKGLQRQIFPSCKAIANSLSLLGD